MLEIEDAAEKIARARRDRRGKYVQSMYWGLCLLMLGLIAWHWVTGGGVTQTKIILAALLAISVIGALNASGFFDNHAELRFRTKEINHRLIEIERALSERTDT